MNFSKRAVSDDLLRLMVETQIEAGVSPAKVHELIEAFASYDQEPDQETEIIGFLGVEDISPDRRGTFVSALLALAEDPDRRTRHLRQNGELSPPDMPLPAALVVKALAMLRLRASSRA